MYRQSYLQSRSKDKDVENKPIDTNEEEEGGINWEIGVDIYTLLILYVKYLRIYCGVQGNLLNSKNGSDLKNGNKIKEGSTYLLLFSHQVMSDSLQPHGLWHTRLPCLHYPLEFAQIHVH